MRHRPAVVIVSAVLVAVSGCTSGEAGSTGGATTAPATSATPAASAVSTPTTTATTTPTTTPTSRGSSTSAARSSSGSPRPAPTPPRPVARGTVVVLNPGHNGGNASHTGEINRLVPAGYGEKKACDTTGTQTDDGYSEHAFTWDVATRVRRGLEATGVTVVLTRRNDDGVGPCVDERAAIGNRADVAAVVSIHADGAPASGHGFHVNQASRRPDGATRAVASQSRTLGRELHATLERSSGLTPSTYIGSDGYYFRSDLAGLNLATRPATFLELGNMRNDDDAALLSSPAGRARIASAVTEGILDFLRR